MFDFLRAPRARRPSVGVCRALEADGLPPHTDISSLRAVESRGTYAGRGVTYFSVFDPVRAAASGVDMLAPRPDRDRDLKAYPGVVLRSGFTEQDGTVVLYARPSAVDAAGRRRSSQVDSQEAAS